MGDPAYVRNHREPGHFWADNEIIDHYLPAIGIYGFAVYMLLTKFADHKTGQCDPSVEGMARKLGISAPTIRKALEKLKEHGLITIRHRRIKRDDKLINQTSIYTLLAVKKPEGYIPGQSPLVGNGIDHPGKGDLVPLVKEVDQGTKGDLPGVLKDVSSNKNHENKNHEGEGVDQEKANLKSTPAPFFEALAELCCMPMALATQKQRADLGSVATKLNAIGATVEQLGHFKAWWFSDSNWRTRKATEANRKPDAPRPMNVLEDWGNAMAIPVIKSNGARAAPERPPLPIVQPNPSAVDPAESRRKTAELMRELRGT